MHKFLVQCGQPQCSICSAQAVWSGAVAMVQGLSQSRQDSSCPSPTRSYSLSREGFKKLLNVQNSPQQEEIRYGSSIRTTSIRSLRHVFFEGSPLVAKL